MNAVNFGAESARIRMPFSVIFKHQEISIRVRWEQFSLDNKHRLIRLDLVEMFYLSALMP